eukprot:CAMPEP_0118915538 /NCGR_PEP_ID=MMETSP1166-20130328/15682_1 /TAXON_ID=1104430 /ORGANISM="Chrysoreinhardia sp, Strain CCMP3193" /LENGTH=450 /DNA_ID=CAMNT_0006855245 /DNA_START=123 /DNA_END=1472 /DNA_ORIENTATION=-
MKKFVVGTSYDKTNNWCWMREIFFDVYMRIYRKLGEATPVPWGKISVQFHFVDYYHATLVLHMSWLAVRRECLPILRGHLDRRPVRLFYDFLENHLPCAVYYIPALKMDPGTARGALARFLRVAVCFNATGYSGDLLQFCQDYDNLRRDRRLNVDENLPKLVGVIIEYIHGKLAESVRKHSISTVESINEQHACLESLERGIELLYLIIGRDAQLTATYHIPDIFGSDELVGKLAQHLRVLVKKAVTATARSATKTVTKKGKVEVIDDPSRFVISGLVARDITVAKCVFLDEAEALASKQDDTIESLRKALALENEIPESLPFTGAVDKQNQPVPIAKMTKGQVVSALNDIGVTSASSRDPIASLRQQLAPHYRKSFILTATAATPQLHKHKELGQVCELTRALGRGDFRRIGAEGVFTRFDREESTTAEHDPALALSNVGQLLSENYFV